MLLIAIACAAAAYFAANWIGDTLIEKVYLDQKAMQKRERAIVSELQTYVQENRISSRDTDAVARWSMSKSDTYVMLYRNQRLAFEAGWWGVDDVDEADAPPLLSNSAGVYPIYFTDGPMQAVVYDFSESRLYTLTTIVSVLIGCFVLMCFMLSYNGRITRTIVTIAAEVEQIGRGDLTARLEKPRGNDELAGLTESVERMRASLLHKTEEEQKALKQNSDLITALSHDIRNPLTALLGYLDIISAQRDLPPDTASYLAACQERAGRIKQLTDELFRYSCSARRRRSWRARVLPRGWSCPTRSAGCAWMCRISSGCSTISLPTSANMPTRRSLCPSRPCRRTGRCISASATPSVPIPARWRATRSACARRKRS